tara:strand:+ start:12130 stop:13194 length:1065 start_codon:yes stop_codon:yes gene_type:complete
MATVTKTIGTSSRDYSTISAWEADLDNTGVYDTGDDAVGECYADGTFTDILNINGGATSGLSSITLRAAEGQKHAGTPGVGVKISSSPGSTQNLILCSSICKIIIEDIEIGNMTMNSGGQTSIFKIASSNTPTTVIQRMIIHDVDWPSGNGGGFILRADSDVDFQNSFIYANENDSNAMYGVYPASGGTSECYNLTIFKLKGATATYGIYNNGSLVEVKNCISFIDTTGAGSPKDFVPAGEDWDYNISGDDTADDGTAGTNSFINQTDSNVLVSTTTGSEDLHILLTSNAVKNGINLTNTPAGVLWDIDGRPRPSTRWDIGADQISFAASALERKLKLSYMNSLSLGDNSLASF